MSSRTPPAPEARAEPAPAAASSPAPRTGPAAAAGPSPDAIVVGAGIVGAACAAELARDGLRVLVLDAGFPGGATTAAGMGHIVVMDDSPAQLALTRYSRALLTDVARELPRACELDWCGTLWLAEEEAELAAMAEKARVFAAAGVATELLDARALADAEPNLRPGLAGALRVPGDAVVYPPAVARWLLAGAAERGARVRTGARVLRLEPGVVVLEGERLEAELVVNAAGAAAGGLVSALPIVPRKGHLAITARAPGFCRHQLVELGYHRSAHGPGAASVAFNVQPRTTGQVLVGSSRELVGWDASLNRRVLARMLARAVAFVPALARLPVLRAWTGFRPATADRLPLIGPFESDRLWVAAGHEGLGITTALGTGRLLADLVAGRDPAIDPAPYSPGRLLAEA